MTKTGDVLIDEILALCAGLDKLMLQAVYAVVCAMAEGKDASTAYAEGNKILIAAGRKPVPYHTMKEANG